MSGKYRRDFGTDHTTETGRDGAVDHDQMLKPLDCAAAAPRGKWPERPQLDQSGHPGGLSEMRETFLQSPDRRAHGEYPDLGIRIARDFQQTAAGATRQGCPIPVRRFDHLKRGSHRRMMGMADLGEEFRRHERAQ